MSRVRIYHIGTADNASAPIWDRTVRYYWQDKAGGYGIQDPFGMKVVKRIVGDYYSVIGLPVSRLAQILRNDFGFDI